jgi:hypothetical protein
VVPLRKVSEEKATMGVRVGNLLRVASYLDVAIISMWAESSRTLMMIGMTEASVRGEGPGGRDEDLLKQLRALVGEAREYYSAGDFPAAMARMRVAHDLVDLRIIALSEG